MGFLGVCQLSRPSQQGPGVPRGCDWGSPGTQGCGRAPTSGASVPRRGCQHPWGGASVPVTVPLSPGGVPASQGLCQCPYSLCQAPGAGCACHCPQVLSSMPMSPGAVPGPQGRWQLPGTGCCGEIRRGGGGGGAVLRRGDQRLSVPAAPGGAHGCPCEITAGACGAAVRAQRGLAPGPNSAAVARGPAAGRWVCGGTRAHGGCRCMGGVPGDKGQFGHAPCGVLPTPYPRRGATTPGCDPPVCHPQAQREPRARQHGGRGRGAGQAAGHAALGAAGVRGLLRHHLWLGLPRLCPQGPAVLRGAVPDLTQPQPQPQQDAVRYGPGDTVPIPPGPLAPYLLPARPACSLSHCLVSPVSGAPCSCSPHPYIPTVTVPGDASFPSAPCPRCPHAWCPGCCFSCPHALVPAVPVPTSPLSPCPRCLADCSGQDEQFSLIFTIGSFMNNFMTLPMGYVFDRFGTAVARLIAM